MAYLEPAKAERKRREIAHRCSRRQKDFSLDDQRFRDLSKLARFWHPDGHGDYVLPDTPNGRYLAIALITHRRHHPNLMQWLIQFSCERAPWLEPDEIDVARLRPHKADILGRLLQLTASDRAELSITTIGACDQTREQRAALRKAKKQEQQRSRRRTAGSMPREEYEAKSLSRLTPWKAEGISRSTWYRRQRAIETSLTPTKT